MAICRKKEGGKRFKCLRCGKEVTLARGFPDEKIGGECLGDRKGKHWWTGV